MQTIHLSDNTFEKLKALAIPFEDKDPEDVILRLIKHAESSSRVARSRIESVTLNGPEADLVSHAGRIPHGSQLRATYKGRQYNAEVRDGRVDWNGDRFSSLSSAAIAVIQSTGSKRPTENGWRFWEVKTPQSGRWRPGTDFRRS